MCMYYVSKDNRSGERTVWGMGGQLVSWPLLLVCCNFCPCLCTIHISFCTATSLRLLNPEDKGTMMLLNTTNCLPFGMVQHPRRPVSLAAYCENLKSHRFLYAAFEYWMVNVKLLMTEISNGYVCTVFSNMCHSYI